jgi:hypothetical protein
MKWSWLVPVILMVVLVCIISWPQQEHFADVNTLVAQRQQLKMEGERRYNDFARMQSPNVNLSADNVADALGNVIPVHTTKRGESLLSTLGLGLFGAADDGSNKSGDHVEQTGVLQEKINFCERITDVTCDVLDDPRYSECGICHKNGVNSKGKPHRGGMYISPDDQIRANEVAKTNGTRAVYKPTIGGCDPDSFTVMKDSCVAKGRQLECDTAGAPTSSNECGQCFGGSGTLMYVGAKPKQFPAVLHVSHPGFQSLQGNGITIKNTTTGELFSVAPSKKKDVLDPKEIYMQIAEGNNLQINIYGVPAIWCAWLSSTDGKRVVGIDIGVQSINPVSGLVVVGDKRSKKVSKPMSEVKGWDTYKDTVPSTVLWYARNRNVVPPAILSASYSAVTIYEDYGSSVSLSDDNFNRQVKEIASASGTIDLKSGPIMSLKTGVLGKYDSIANELINITMDDGSVKQASGGTGGRIPNLQTSVQINVSVPATLANPFYDVDVVNCPAGPMVLTEYGAGLMGANSCFDAKGQFNPTIYCMTGLFEAAGGTTAGTLYPDTKEKANALVINNSLDATVDNINNMANSAIYGIDNDGAPVDFATQKDLSVKMLGITLNNPCDGLNSKKGPHSTACLDYLWRTSGNAAPLGTNVDPASVPYAYCHSGGAAAPLKSAATIQAANDLGDIQTIRNAFYGLFTRAQDSSSFDAQAAMMNACYGVKINKPTGPPPVCPPQQNANCDWITAVNAAPWVQMDGNLTQASIGNDDRIVGIVNTKHMDAK